MSTSGNVRIYSIYPAFDILGMKIILSGLIWVCSLGVPEFCGTYIGMYTVVGIVFLLDLHY